MAVGKEVTDDDRLIGERIVAIRRSMNMSQTALATAIGVTFQQVQKYEKGVNRVGGGRLQEIARTLQVPVSALFGEDAQQSGTDDGTFSYLGVRGAVQMLRAYASIEDTVQQSNVLSMVLTAAKIDERSREAHA